jgi:DNA invertase Pin-like site-specific DNA recombinase
LKRHRRTRTQMNRLAICYYRVSTSKQGTSGLGLEAQRTLARDYCYGKGLVIIEEFEEVQSGGANDRTKVREALDRCELSGARLVVAKLDRISRDVGFIDMLLKSGTTFVCADMPEANESMIQFLSVFAQYERRMASERTKAALAQKKQRAAQKGEPAGLGNPNMAKMRKHIPGNLQALGTAARMAKSAERMLKIRPLIEQAKKDGCGSLRSVAEWLNERHIQTTKGKPFTATAVKRIIDGVIPA